MAIDIINSSYIRKTTLFDFHISAGAKIIEFAGWAMPVYYTSILKEAAHVRNGIGIFDASHMGELFVSGKDRLKFLQHLTTNDISILKEKRMQYTLCCNKDGGILDDFMVYNLGSCFMCVTNASNTHNIYMHFLTQSKNYKVDIEDRSKEISLLCIQGDRSHELVSKIFNKNLSKMYYMDIERFKFNNSEVIISRSGYTGEDGFEVYTDNMTSHILWERIFADKSSNAKPCGLGARDVLRLEMGYTLYGIDIDESVNPVAASLMWIVKNRKDPAERPCGLDRLL
jgi:aminomethyltransferase